MAASQHLLAASKHPVVVLVAGTLLGSVLIPAVNRQIDRERRLQELRTAHANTVLRSSWDVERKLNLLQTAFESFYKDEVVSALSTRESRQALRDRVYALHQDFNRDAWWWHWQMLEEVKILRLMEDTDVSQLEQAVNRYQEVLLATIESLDRYWAQLIRSPEPISAEDGLQTVSEVNSQLRTLGNRRRQAVREMVALIVS